MKFLLTTFLLTFFIGAFAQSPNLPIDSATHLITFTEVVKVDGNKDELYSRAREWFAKTYKSSTNVIQMDDKESGKIVGKALMDVYYRGGHWGYINYTISIYLKDGRYKYEVTNFYHKGEYRGGGTYIGNTYIENSDVPDYGDCEKMMHEKTKHKQKVFNVFLNEIIANISDLTTSLKESMSKKASITKDDF